MTGAIANLRKTAPGTGPSAGRSARRRTPVIEILARLSAKDAAVVRQLPPIPCDHVHLGALLNLVVRDGKRLTRLGDVRHSSGRTWRDLVVAELDRQPARSASSYPFGYEGEDDDDDD